MRALSALRKSATSKRYFSPPSHCWISSLSAAGYAQAAFSLGVRKQPTICPLTGRTGKVPGTPSMLQVRPSRERMSQSRSAFTQSAVANPRPVYE